MSIKRTLLALGVLAAVMLTGCKDPGGLPNGDVHTATVDSLYCYPANYASHSGHVDKFKTALNEWYTRWGAPDHMDTRIVECSMKPEVRFGYREEAAADLLA